MEFYIYFISSVIVIVILVIIKTKKSNVISGTDLYNELNQQTKNKDK